MAADYHMNSPTTIPDSIIESINIVLDTQHAVLETFKKIECLHWTYLDDYRDINRRRYPTLTIQTFAIELFRAKNMPHRSHEILNYIRVYTRHKKSLPTAGVIFYANSDQDLRFVVVKMRGSDIWSMPKGKRDGGDMSLLKTAEREFHEETGLDISEFMGDHLPVRTINRTRFYMLEAGSPGGATTFTGYNTREIDDVRWVSTAEVIACERQYSKQCLYVAQELDHMFRRPATSR
jgi:8-oxo-dGTP pyrophosphatase MutT (NUDIX family)